MKRKDKDAKSNLSLDELRAELAQLKEKRFRLGFKHRVTPLNNALELRTLRRDIARVRTWIRRKELAALGDPGALRRAPRTTGGGNEPVAPTARG